MSTSAPALERVLDIGAKRKQLQIYSITIAPDFKTHMSCAGWQLVSDISCPPQIRFSSIQAVEFLLPQEVRVSGRTMLSRAIPLQAVLGQRHAEALVTNQKILQDWDKKIIVPFLGTIWESSNKMKRICCLSHYPNCGWNLIWRWLDHRRWNALLRLPKIMETM
jgi:hypothetical protein